jgi:hypothetical protein
MRYGKSVWTLVFLAGGLLNAADATAQERAVSFANLRFGASPAMVLEAMKGLKLVDVDKGPDSQFPLDQRFEGEMKGSPVLVSALYDQNGQLEKVQVAFLTPDEDCVALYRTLKKELQGQYGKPIVDLERWDFPYNNGGHVGQEHFAIRTGKGLLATAWERHDAGTMDGGVALTTSENVIVRLAYESSKWGAESERRKKILSSENTPDAAGPDGGNLPRRHGLN